jgi:hypothetical protein
MSTDRAKCLFMVTEGPAEQRSITVVMRDEIPALSGRTLSFDLDPDATPEQARTFSRVLRRMVTHIVVSG